MFGDDTTVGIGSEFPETPWSLVSVPDRSEAERKARLDELFRIYWRPMYRYVRIKWKTSNELTKDLIQEFCIQILDGDFLEKYKPEKGRFRTFVRASLDNLVRNHHRGESRLKRGGDRRVLSLELDMLQERDEVIAEDSSADPAEQFDREWCRALMEAAVARVEADFEKHGKGQSLKVFRDFEDQLRKDRRPSYQEIAGRHGLSTVDVSNRIQAVKKALRRAVMEQVRDSVSDAENFRSELSFVSGTL